MCDEYWGWPNYVTHAAFGWLTSEEDAWLYEMAGEYASEYAFAEGLQYRLRAGYEESGQWPTLFLSDLLGWAWEEIDWNYLAGKFWENRIVKESENVQ